MKIRRVSELFILFILIISMITGCWDKVEIEDRAYAMAIGIDLVPSSKKYAVTFQFPDVSQIARTAPFSQGSKPSYSVTEIANTVFSASRHISTKLNKRLFLGHTKAIILGENIVNNKIRFLQVLDSLDRSYELSKKMHILVTPGKAEDILTKKYDFDPNVGIYIDDIFKQYNKTSMYPNIDYNKVVKSLSDTNGNAIIPKITSSNNELKLSGSAIIKDYKLDGWLTDDENMGYMWLMNMVKGGDITFNMPIDGENVKVPFNITNVVTRKDVTEQNGKIIYKLRIEVEGDFTEYSFQKHGQMFNTSIMNTMENKANKTIESMINKALEKFQKDLKVDMIGVGNYIEKYKPDIWGKVGANWKDKFPDVEVNAVVSTHIRRIGLFK